MGHRKGKGFEILNSWVTLVGGILAIGSALVAGAAWVYSKVTEPDSALTADVYYSRYIHPLGTTAAEKRLEALSKGQPDDVHLLFLESRLESELRISDDPRFSKTKVPDKTYNLFRDYLSERTPRLTKVALEWTQQRASAALSYQRSLDGFWAVRVYNPRPSPAQGIVLTLPKTKYALVMHDRDRREPAEVAPVEASSEIDLGRITTKKGAWVFGWTEGAIDPYDHSDTEDVTLAFGSNGVGNVTIHHPMEEQESSWSVWNWWAAFMLFWLGVLGLVNRSIRADLEREILRLNRELRVADKVLDSALDPKS